MMRAALLLVAAGSACTRPVPAPYAGVYPRKSGICPCLDCQSQSLCLQRDSSRVPLSMVAAAWGESERRTPACCPLGSSLPCPCIHQRARPPATVDARVPSHRAHVARSLATHPLPPSFILVASRLTPSAPAQLARTRPR